ncbi:unnamed protein product [Closterium sp. Yama58-4]|nr:unnamed protein product [Closterium sp. Yama58-4]
MSHSPLSWYFTTQALQQPLTSGHLTIKHPNIQGPQGTSPLKFFINHFPFKTSIKHPSTQGPKVPHHAPRLSRLSAIGITSQRSRPPRYLTAQALQLPLVFQDLQQLAFQDLQQMKI